MSTDLKNLSIAELKRIKRDNQQKLKNEYSQCKIHVINKIEKVREKLNPNPNPNPNHKTKPAKIKKLKSIFRSV